jgi:hypothetical protein
MHSPSCLLTLAAALCLASVTHAADVRDFGAKGDGVTDDTAAFQAALDSVGAENGGIVSVPTGKYRIASHLVIPPSVTLEGNWRYPPTIAAYHSVPGDQASPPSLSGSVLLATEGAGQPEGTPFISLRFNSCLKGVTIFYPEQTKTNPPVAYPWTVAAPGTDNASIVDVLMVNPYQAVNFGNTAGRHYIRNLYAQALYRGLVVDLCYDIGRIENVHFWPFWTAADTDSPVMKFTYENGEAFIFGKADWEYVTNCFAISYKIGFRFIDSPAGAGPGNVLLTQSGGDCCAVAVQVDNCQAHAGISFANSQIFGDLIISPSNTGMVRFTGCGFFGTNDAKRGVALARIAGNGRTSFDNCHFYCIHPESRKADVMIQADGGRLGFSNCLFINSKGTAGVNSNPIPLVLGPDVISALVMGNEFYGEARIVNNARGRVVIEHNLENTGDDPYPAPPN